MNARIVRNWRGVLELIYRCQKCKGTLSSSRMEIEAGEDECPECRNVVHFPTSLLSKFDAAEHQHQETQAAKKENRLAKKKEKFAKKEENRKKIKQFFNGPMGVLVVIVAFFLGLPAGVWGCFAVGDWLYANRTEAQKAAAHSASVSSMISSANNARYDRNFETTQSALRQNYGNATVITQTRVGGGWVTELEGENAFGGTVRNQILTTDTGETVNLSVP